MADAVNSIGFPARGEDHAWVTAYSEAYLSGKTPGTIDVYQRILRNFLLWLDSHSGQAQFPLAHLTHTSVERYMTSLEEAGYSVSHRTRVKSVLQRFAEVLTGERKEREEVC